MPAKTRRDMTVAHFRARLKNKEFRPVLGNLYYESTREGTSSSVNYGAVLNTDGTIARRDTIRHLIAARKEHEAKVKHARP